MKEQALKDRLRIISKEKNLSFNECWKKLLLERFLFRLSKSPLSKKFIFKGGSLLAYILKIGRETIDLDFLITKINAKEKEIKKSIEKIISKKSDDGFIFSFHNIKTLNQTHMFYPGYRIILKVSFGNMKDQIQIDIGIGDIIEPENKNLPLFQYKGKPLFEDEISLLVYPPETIFAEKLETIIARGAANSRMKDYHDLLVLMRKKELLNSQNLKTTVNNTFQHRKTSLKLIKFKSQEFKFLQKLWASHQKNLDITQDLDLPQNISQAIEEINHYLLAIFKNLSKTTD